MTDKKYVWHDLKVENPINIYIYIINVFQMSHLIWFDLKGTMSD